MWYIPEAVPYVFDPLELQQIAVNSIGKGLRVEDLLSDVRSEMLKSYPRHINRNPKWILNNAGGAMGAMCVLHVSLTEYVMIFGTPLGTEGHTGRFYVDDYFIILAGEQWAFSAGQLTRETYRAGEVHHLRRGQAVQNAGNVLGTRICAWSDRDHVSFRPGGWAHQYAGFSQHDADDLGRDEKHNTRTAAGKDLKPLPLGEAGANAPGEGLGRGKY
jgi:hypothetical protein